ncbi:GspE/PulE family protein [Tichowtungia aerotolerans]|uniref:Type II/IV secretion system protein n=1 Tax=Tichowtungia aerotolerans TaxID=2697043 RepID=A0A6P1MBE2_9BACT|nr:GspE/PulE family protein [Tichowtungia aerotolerans]QHI68886.1 type II/IV secretion system protein [Tichowtungia aerotolerans]
MQNSQLAALLQQTGLFREEQVESLMSELAGGTIGLPETVVEQTGIKEELFLEKLAEGMDLPFMRLKQPEIAADVLSRVPPKAVFQYNIIPVSAEDGTLHIATADPLQPGLIDAMRLVTGGRIRLVLSPATDIAAAAKQLYGVGAETLDRMMQDDDRIDLDGDTLLKQDLNDLDQEASVVKFVNQIIWEAHQTRATDIHIEPMEVDLRIRYRIDGVLHQTPVPATLKRFQSSIISRIKVMANMDIAEKRLPQDGRISLRIQGEEIDVRVSTMPTVYGESVSLRLLLRGSGMINMSQLGLEPDDEKVLKKMITRPHGILLCTGPTGSGKSTSLYAWLHTINSVDKRIMSAEDPIEYEMAGVNQVQMKPEIGLTFAHALRTFLRQDPDVIMVGEIRDRETAEIAIRAALTGHLVFSTLHTNDSAGSVNRLLDMGIEPFLVASSVEGIIAQRLIRRLCPSCRKPVEIDDVKRDFLKGEGFPIEELETKNIYEPVGCDDCHGSGFKGRTGIYEILAVDDHIRPLIIDRAASSVIKKEALRHGLSTLREDGWKKVLAGVTTVEEVLRVAEEDEDDEEI